MRAVRLASFPSGLLRWRPTIEAMMVGIPADGPIFVMIDQAVVEAGTCHRRPGLHIDGHWVAEHGKHGHKRDPSKPEALVLAADVMGCRAYVGSYEGEPSEGGDCSAIPNAGMERRDLEPFVAWAGEADTFLHESVPVSRDCRRTVVRLNVPGWTPAHEP